MASMTDVLEQALLDHFFINQTALTRPASLALGLFTAAPNDTGGGTEQAGNGYARVTLNLDSATWSRTNNVITNTNNIVTGAASGGSWGPIVAVGLFNGGTLWFWQTLGSPVTITSGNTLTIPAGTFSITGGGAFTQFAWGQILEWFFRAGALTWPTTLDWRLTSTAPTFTTGGTALTGNGYADLTVNNNGAAWTRTGSRVSNATVMEWAVATPNAWLDVEGIDAFNGANRWLWIDLAAARSVPAGSQFRFIANALGFTAN